MIRRLRLTFILIMMATTAVLLTASFVSLYCLTKRNYEDQIMNDLRSAALSQPRMQSPAPGTKPQDGRGGAFDPHGPGSASSAPAEPGKTPLIVIERSADGTLSVTRNQITRYSESSAKMLTALADETDTGDGMLSGEHLHFFIGQPAPDKTVRYAFADTYTMESALRAQLRYSLLAGFAAFLAFFLLSLWLARRMTAPVEAAWNEQHQFVSDASHELKTPLTVILANTGLLLSMDLPEEASNRLLPIQAEARRMKQLTENLLTLARSDCHAAASAFMPVDLSELTERCALAFEPVAFKAGKTLLTETAPGIRVNGDAEKLHRLLNILLDNACKYGASKSSIRLCLASGAGRAAADDPRSASASGTDAVSRAVLPVPSQKRAVLTVTSEGTPLSEEEIRHIFLRFYRSDPSRGTVPGFGLGLSIAETIVREHGGQILASSDGVKENRFEVRLPLCR